MMGKIYPVWALLIVLLASGYGWPYGEVMVKGVNLGGWLVLEQWMTPGLFEGSPDGVYDEYTFTEYWGKDVAQQKLRNHWDWWVTEADFVQFKEAGLNHIRLPIGYWALDIREGEPWVVGSWDYVLKTAEWCKKYELQLMIDLHGAPGSQNGWDHSGQGNGVANFYYDDENLRRASMILGTIADWANSTEWRDTVTAIELVNEPVLWDDYDFRLAKLKEYYKMAYDEVRMYNSEIVVTVHDAFIDLSNWYYLGEESYYSKVMLDTHIYQVFGDEWRNMTCAEHTAYPCTYHDRLTEANKRLWTVVAEWSLATPAELLCTDQAAFASQQIGAFEGSSGWFMWAHKNAASMYEWSFKHSYERQWIDPIAPNEPQC